ncbi:hypothetical protein [Kiritimatiella glycovorans]|uniref:Uroporphyrinogen decarboxylase (URO-D) domain-containing protein n=1 Tax=Kiritimatiella glycovorans TaxID=1307763 RepID=A0A0G3EGC5_9BACT|nr:hypothetical protein [Kiritimatiella glycovorans]AKJ63835.1 hypothetical protein L21SP4_00564 [Kiritimatiella glycovorans]
MNHRRNIQDVLHYRDAESLPLLHFGYWTPETLQKWADEGHITQAEADGWYDGGPADLSIASKLGFDANWFSVFNYNATLTDPFPREVIEDLPDGSRKVRNPAGVIELEKAGTGGIPMEFDHLLKNRRSWEEHYKPRLQFAGDQIQHAPVNVHGEVRPFGEGGLDYLRDDGRDQHYGLFCGSLLGDIRNWIGMQNLAYMQVDDEALLREIIDTVAERHYRATEYILRQGAVFDFGHFWEDICFKNGPLVSPAMFEEFVGPHYKRITGLLNAHGIDIVSVDCDGCIDALIATWLENGVNTMFPIEVGTWNASIGPWREQYGRELRGVGGMNKTVFARDRAAVDDEIERLKPLVGLGGYLPCPDHRLAPDAEWDLVRYYCDRMRTTFG